MSAYRVAAFRLIWLCSYFLFVCSTFRCGFNVEFCIDLYKHRWEVRIGVELFIKFNALHESIGHPAALPKLIIVSSKRTLLVLFDELPRWGLNPGPRVCMVYDRGAMSRSHFHPLLSFRHRSHALDPK